MLRSTRDLSTSFTSFWAILTILWLLGKTSIPATGAFLTSATNQRFPTAITTTSGRLASIMSASTNGGRPRRASPRKKKVTDFFVAEASSSSSLPSRAVGTRNGKKRGDKTLSSPIKPPSVPSSTTATASVVSSSSLSTLSSSSATTTPPTMTLLEDWLSHTDASFHKFSPDEAAQIRQALLDWYRKYRRKLPWRGDPPPYEGSTAGTNNNNNNNNNNKNGKKQSKTPVETTTVKDYNRNATIHYQASAYGTWVSEIMLQQTRVEAVIPYWLKWMEAFPTIRALAEATEEEVNAHWAGLGFYRRARLLHSAAQHVTTNCPKGQLPETVAELESIPGIGPYTAAAIASISFGVAVPVVDGNVCRVLSRLRGVANHIKAPIFKDKMAWELAAQIVGDVGEDAGDVNQAMMELGATYCAPSGTGVDDNDPLKEFYLSTKLGAAYHREITAQPSSSKTRRHLQNLIADKTREQSSLSSTSLSSSSSKKNTLRVCALCDPRGISTVIEQLSESIEDQTAKKSSDNAHDAIDAARRCGHSVFPTAPPKLTKREEVLAVAVISATVESSGKTKIKKNDGNNDAYWLLVKRPKKGLLAGQWEFPSTCVWNSDEDSSKIIGVKRKAPSSSSPVAKKKKANVIAVPKVGASARQMALGKLMDDILLKNEGVRDKLEDSGKLTKLKVSPLEHVFSHVRHTMWIEYASLTSQEKAPIVEPIDWISSGERDVKWMRESDMKQAGVTSGVKKILKAVQEEQQKRGKKQSFFQPK